MADWVPAKFLLGKMFPVVLISTGGHGVIERGNGSTWVWGTYHFGGGNPSFDWGKWCIWVREIVDLSKKTLLKTEMCCYLMP